MWLTLSFISFFLPFRHFVKICPVRSQLFHTNKLKNGYAENKIATLLPFEKISQLYNLKDTHLNYRQNILSYRSSYIQFICFKMDATEASKLHYECNLQHLLAVR
jgi:hypothetical protein